MSRLDRAIAAFEDETLDMDLGQRISGLRDALIWNAFHTIKRINKLGKKANLAEDEEYKHIECMARFKMIEQLYSSQLKMNKAAGKPAEVSHIEFMNKLKEMKSSVGEIIQTIPVNG